jgi:hypothetical protein
MGILDLGRLGLREEKTGSILRMNRKIFAIGLIAVLSVYSAVLAYAADTGWPEGKFFKLGQTGGRPVFIDPRGRPFYSKAMVYAYGPEQGPLKGKVTSEVALRELELMKEHGFNTLDLYGDTYLQDILKWCDKNEFAVYFRTSYTNKEFPDFMDPKLREETKHFYDKFLTVIKGRPSVLAIDMDQRWLFDLNWAGKGRSGVPKLGPESINYLPAWLEGKYKKIGYLNQLWRRQYASFADVLKDKDIISGGMIRDLDSKPWRVDLVEYTLWTINDFLKEQTAYMRMLDPDHLITYTTELPEVAPFPISTRENSGIDFISPVHYNLDADYNRDWIANAELLYMTKFHYDLSNLPVFINESGFRTTFLAATPENMGYAAARMNDEGHVAELYLRQSSLTAAYPWMLGWAWFKWYDKLFEGDFGYIRDDRSLKPISNLGQYINAKMAVNMKAEKKPDVWIYYPEYALASPMPTYQQDRTLILLLENDFLTAYEKMVAEAMPDITNPGPKAAEARIVNDLPEVFNQKWVPFAFTSTIPEDSNPILLSGSALEQLSLVDRMALAGKRTITFGQVGITDERYNQTEPWYLEAVGISKDVLSEKDITVPLEKYFNNDGISRKKNPKDGNFDGEGNTYPAEDLPEGKKVFTCREKDATFKFPDKADRALNNIRCKGQNIEIPRGVYTKANFLLSSSNGDICRKVSLIYGDGSSDELYFAPAISDWKNKPHFGHAAIGEKGAFMVHLAVPVSPAKILTSIRLPDAEQIHIFALTLTEGGAVKGTEVEVQKGDITTSGFCYWALSLKKPVNAPYNVLATFKNGNPAIVQSKDGKHIAFLYDPLTWDNKEGEISADIKNGAEILRSLMLK